LTFNSGKEVYKVADPISAAAVANEFLDIQDREPLGFSFPKIDPMKLQKLLFYAQGWWLAIKKEGPLFREEIYAWPWGPVIPHIYGEFKSFGRNPIVGRRAIELVKTGEGVVGYTVATPAMPSEEVRGFLKNVWDVHKPYSGVQLSNATHAPGEPWTIVRDKYGSLESKPLIPNELIKDIFTGKLKR
jgi:uncharacterized phage-associated protein